MQRRARLAWQGADSASASRRLIPQDNPDKARLQRERPERNRRQVAARTVRRPQARWHANCVSVMQVSCVTVEFIASAVSLSRATAVGRCP